MKNRRFSKRSMRSLRGVDPRLIVMVTETLHTSPIDFVVIEGLRTKERQRELVRIGASKTMNSYHLTGHAVDLAALVDGKIRWDWPLYEHLARGMKRSASQHRFDMEWGGDWRSFPDGPHFQVSR